jgi:hypothetical protein
MRFVFSLLLAVIAVASSIETPVDALIAAVRTAIDRHTADKSLAGNLRKLTLSERLDMRTIEELESLGAGPETVGALYDLREFSAGRKPAASAPLFPPPRRPTVEEQKESFRQISANAMHYSAGLPNFICTESIRRYTLPPNRASLFAPPVWQAKDTLTVKLTYYDNREKYELTHLNGRTAARDYESSGGAVSEGDFGSMLLEIFAPDTQTKFLWDHWTYLRKRLTQVYSYRTLQEHSHFKIGVGANPKERKTIIAGRNGFIYADNETHMVMRITGEAESIPLGFPIILQSNMVDYDLADVGGRQVLLPLRAEQRISTAELHFKNVVEFHDYRKFSAESSISFDK